MLILFDKVTRRALHQETEVSAGRSGDGTMSSLQQHLPLCCTLHFRCQFNDDVRVLTSHHSGRQETRSSVSDWLRLFPEVTRPQQEVTQQKERDVATVWKCHFVLQDRGPCIMCRFEQEGQSDVPLVEQTRGREKERVAEE